MKIANSINLCSSISVLEALKKIYRFGISTNLNLNLSLGNIIDPFDVETRKSLYDHSVDPDLLKKVDFFLRSVTKVKHIRLWINTNDPDDACLKAFIATKYDNHKISICDINASIDKYKRNAVRNINNLNIRQLKALKKYEYILSFNERQECQNNWNKFILENAELRTIVDGVLASVCIDFYDKAIMNELHRINLPFMRSLAYLLTCFPSLSETFLRNRLEYLIDTLGLDIK
ncbi:DUF3658 domain-containing protein [Fusibacter sp. 3D3]|uniref:DUF3658 domain-containing protein n=1 Tax=Fusibacter sp. 3D3 TaxID=1048380 RepID=UPI00085321E2|nr:DUF3658 domain-containing protein [Fusibacter sp. 3D3]GAU75931.1 hypothetical protein F3D3_0527 [Fusibacter sp. 3D3]